MNDAPLAARLSSRGAAAGVALLAAALRLPWLSRLGLQGDEDVSTLAARGILEYGWPRLPSGHVYLRALIYHYVIAPLVALDIDWLPRLVAVAASVVTAYLLVRIARHWVGDTVAFVGGLLFAVSLVEIDLARQVRFYSPYQLCALLVFAACYRFWTDSRFRWCALGAAAILLSTGFHLLGTTLAIVFLLAAVRTTRHSVTVVTITLVVTFALFAQWQGTTTYAAHMGGRSAVVEFSGSASSEPETNEIVFGGEPLAFGRGLLGTMGFLLAAGLPAVLFGALAFVATRQRPPVARTAAIAGLATAAALAGAHQIGLSLTVLVLLVLQRAELLPDRRGGQALLGTTAGVAALSALWVLAGLLSHHGPRELALGFFGRHLGRFVRNLLIWPPAISMLAVVGCTIVLWRAWNGKASDGERFVGLVLVALTAGRAVLASKSQERYLADIWPLWELLAAGGLVAGVTWLSTWRLWGHRGRLAAGAGATAAVLFVLILPGTSPLATYRYLSRSAGEPVDEIQAVAPFATDFRGVAAWLQPRLRANDRVVATDWLSTYCYVGRVDGWIRSTGYGGQSVLIDGVPRDVYLGAQVLPDVAALESFLEAGAVWLVAGGSEWTDETKLDEDTRAWLGAHEPVFVATDGRTRIYRLE